MNPRGGVPHRLSRPAPSVSEEGVLRGEVNYNGSPPPVDNKLVKAFKEWLNEVEGISADTTSYYAGIIRRREWPPQKRAHKKAWRKYVKFLAVKGLIDPIKKMAWLDALQLGKYDPTKKTQAAVPLDEVLKVRKVLGGLGLTQIFVIGLGGARLSHIVRMLTGWQPNEIVEHPHGLLEARLLCTDTFCRYFLGITSGRKKCHYIYYPAADVPNNIKLTYNKVKEALRHKGVQFKVLRKFAEQRLTQLAHQNNIPLDAVKLILSRGLTVSGTHYLNTRDWADRLFEIYVREVIKPLIQG